MGKRKWLVISYNLPSEPSRLRVATWRSLKKLGAVNIQQSMWVLAYNEKNYLALQKISREIEKNGEVLLMESVFLSSEHEEKVISYFDNARDEEYKEFIEKCDDFFKEIEKEIAIEKFTFAEVEEEEEELKKLLSWFTKIEARDIFNPSQRERAREKLDSVKKAFESYSDMVYQYNKLS